MYNHILLAADGFENAVRAAKEAIKIASCNKEAVIEVVYVADFEKAKSEVLHSTSNEALNLERRKKISKIEQLLRESNISYKVNILHGTPGPEIVKYATGGFGCYWKSRFKCIARNGAR